MWLWYQLKCLLGHHTWTSLKLVSAYERFSICAYCPAVLHEYGDKSTPSFFEERS